MARKCKISEAKKKLIARHIKAGKTPASELAAKYGISVSYVYHIAKEY